MMMFFLFYTLGAIVTYGGVLGYWQSQWSDSNEAKKQYNDDLSLAIECGIMWPIGLLAHFIMCGRKPLQSGLKFY